MLPCRWRGMQQSMWRTIKRESCFYGIGALHLTALRSWHRQLFHLLPGSLLESARHQRQGTIDLYRLKIID